MELCAIRHSFPRTMGYVGQDQQIPTSDFKGAAEANDKTCTFYPIAQRQIQSMYAKETWDEVSRYGLDAIKLTKIPEWAAHVVPGETGNYTLR